MRNILASLALLMLCACAQLPPPVGGRVILLPGPDGRSSGELHVKDAAAADAPWQLLLDPYAQIERVGGALRRSTSTAQSVQQLYGGLLARQPMRPRRYIVNFATGSTQLTPETAPLLEQVREALAEQPAGEVIVIGHTDRVGSVEANDKLSVARADAVRELLVAKGVPREQISVAGRGEREPLVRTADEVPEARNRRVEIKLR